MDYGRSMLDEWMLDPSVTYLNHATVGAPPRRVIDAQRALQDEIERQPAEFLLRELADTDGAGTPARPRMRVAAEAVASFVGCSADQLGFVDNATTGANAILRSFPFALGDEVLVTSLGYGGVTNAASYATSAAGAVLRCVAMPNPGAPSESFTAAIVSALTDRTRIVIVDHISAQTALVLPIAAIIEACHARGVLVLVDGAHVPGAIPLDIDAIGADWYIANLHKWAFAPRSSGFVWVSAAQRAHLHPAVISWGLGHGMAAEFDLAGTRDPTPWLIAPMAIELLGEWGGRGLMDHNHDLAWRSAHRLAQAWGTTFDTPEEMIGPMASVALPPSLGSTKPEAVALQRELFVEDRIEVPIYPVEGGLRLRICAQIYNDDADYDRLAAAVSRRS